MGCSFQENENVRRYFDVVKEVMQEVGASEDEVV